MSGAFSERLSFLGSSGAAAGSRKGVPSGEVTRLEGEGFWRSLGFLGVDAGLGAGSVDNEGLTAGTGLSPFLDFTGGVAAGLAAGLTGAAAVGIGEASSLPLSGVSAGLAAGAGAAVVAGLAEPAGLAPVAGAALAAGAAFGVKLGGGTVLGSSFFIFSFSSV